MNLVLFLGAGFSKPFGLPVMTEFYDYAVGDRSPLDGQERKRVRDLRDMVRKSASMLDADEGNLEDLLSVSLFWDEGWPGTASQELLMCLWKVYRALNTTSSDGPLKAALRRLVGFKQIDSHHHTVITTNYDVVAEYAFWWIGRPLGLPGEWKPTADKEKAHALYDSLGSTRIICKLHGSVNWFLGQGDDPGGTLQVDGRIKDEVEPTPEGLVRSCVPHVSWKKCRPPEVAPLIIPPTLYKGDYPSCIHPVWKAARDALQRADRVVFVGYSFPPSDTHMKYFLACSLVENLDLKSIDILDTRASAIFERLRSGDEGFGSTLKKKLQPYEGKWEENHEYDILRS